MWPFKKKPLELGQLPLDGPWLVAEGKHGAMPMFVRTNTAYRDCKSVPGYEHRVGIAVPLVQAEANGLPGTAELALLSDIEEMLCDSLQEQAESLLVAVITTSGMREFVFYTRAPHRVEQRIADLREHITSHEIQLTIQPDETWRVYAQLE